jgi:hypothetical protein
MPAQAPCQIGVRDSCGLMRSTRSQAVITSSKRPSRDIDEQQWYEVDHSGSGCSALRRPRAARSSGTVQANARARNKRLVRGRVDRLKPSFRSLVFASAIQASVRAESAGQK